MIRVKGVNADGTMIGDGGDGAQILLESECLPMKVCRIASALMSMVCKVMQASTVTDCGVQQQRAVMLMML